MNSEKNIEKLIRTLPLVSSVNDQSTEISNLLKDQSKNECKEVLSNIKQLEKKEDMLLEEISSDDDMALEDSDEFEDVGSDIEANSNDCFEDFNKTFNPSLFEANPLRCIQDPTISVYDLMHRKSEDHSKCIETSRLLEYFECLKLEISDINENWISTVEEIIQILPKNISQILDIPDYYHKVFDLVNLTLNFECASKSHSSMSTLIIRHLKVGLNLVEVLCQYSDSLAEHLIKHHQVHIKLFNLYFAEHMCLSLKLNILRTLDSSLNGPEPLRLFLYSETFNDLNGYQTLLKILGMHERPRVCFLLTSILRKIHFYELLHKMNTDLDILDDNCVSILSDCISEINTTFIRAPILMGCPKRFLQARAQFELASALKHSDVYPTIYRLFDDSNFLNRIVVLLEISNSSLHSIEHNLINLLSNLLDLEHGLRYLGCRYKELNNLIKILNNISPQLAINIIYRIKVLSLVDYLIYFWECNLLQNFKFDLIESVDVLHDVFCLTQSPIGKQAVVTVLTMGNNMDVIVNYFKYFVETKSTNNDLYIIYASDLLNIILEGSENISYLEKYGPLLYELSCKHSCLNNIIAWTFPTMKYSSFFHDDVTELCNNVKSNTENCLTFDKTLITSLRILKYLAAPEYEMVFKNNEDFIELKYKYIILQMYSFDMLEYLLKIVENICDHYKQPSLNVWKLAGGLGTKVLSIMNPCMVLIRCMLTLLIQNSGNSYKDLTPIKVLLKLYNLMHYIIEYSSEAQEEATRVSKDVHKTFLTFIEYNLGSNLINEIIMWTLSSPSNFLPGMIILCELLPLPLPIHSLKPLDDNSLSAMTSYRNLWAEHLNKVSHDVIDLISILGVSSTVITPLKSFCVQVSDLSASLCLLITESILDALLNPNNTLYFDKWFSLLTKLCEHSTIKAAVLQILHERKTQENYETFIKKICEKIIDQQGSAITLIKFLCDTDIMINSNFDIITINNSVPDKQLFYEFISALINLLELHSDTENLSLIFKTLLTIIKTDYGFYNFKTVLDIHPNVFYIVLNSFSRNINQENANSDLLRLFLQLLISCISNNLKINRKLFINTLQLKTYLQWEKSTADHPLCTLKENMQMENSVNLKSILELIELLDVDNGISFDLEEPQVPIVSSLTSLFKERSIYVVDNLEEDSIIIDFNTQIENTNDLVECNLEDTLMLYPEFNVKDNISNLFTKDYSIVQSEPIVVKEEESIKKKTHDILPSTPVVSAPSTRHKVFSRLGAVQRQDTFRNRLPNTSRPPSLHVDDFVALESRSSRQHCYKLPIQPIQDLNITLRERQMAYERTYNILNSYKTHISMQNWHTHASTLAHLRANYRQTLTSRHLELQRHSLIAEWRQLRLEASQSIRKNRTFSRR
ncbi:protein virilizer-like isoform X2 [Daktulosphaira vitifoliae]|uniref:protein virilizer-like isoform X2 n=1 Tax=Daktulosphaira vitifoliae TaxID=58002 RepID=UPI0021A9EA49|nr:protein virilizer-like isoform X2 [Daktulosphaira vitifoliae]